MEEGGIEDSMLNGKGIYLISLAISLIIGIVVGIIARYVENKNADSKEKDEL